MERNTPEQRPGHNQRDSDENHRGAEQNAPRDLLAKHGRPYDQRGDGFQRADYGAVSGAYILYRDVDEQNRDDGRHEGNAQHIGHRGRVGAVYRAAQVSA